ncbi:substrate-binding domain-containing protein [Leminorella grimontii]|uniref:substrate-binding domain-containing protein n=1 Tax=Leminorella grimontii TaxID=82981 RepID=UPI00322047D2
MKLPKAIAVGLCMSITGLAASASAYASSDKPVTLRVISSMATRQVLSELVVPFEKQSGYRIELASVGGVNAAKRIEAGEDFDVVILASGAIDTLIASGKVVPDSKTCLVKSGVAIAVREGATRMDIGSEEAVKQAVLSAKTVGYSTGPSGVYLFELFQRWGIADQIKDRIVQAPAGVPVGALVAKGEVELGFQQLSELLHQEDITVLGPLPADIQTVTRFCAGITVKSAQREAVQALLDYLTSPETNEVKIKNGMDPI